MQDRHSINEKDENFPRNLSDLCIQKIVSNLERYPADSFIILEESLWDEIVIMRHRKTSPMKGKGGIDGTGRLQPAVSDKFIAGVESANPHLRQSQCADQYFWKDCVNYRFPEQGLSRPKSLQYPYPVLLQLLDDAVSDLTSCLSKECNEEAIASALKSVEAISSSPMDLSLLKTTAIGKKVKKFLAKSKGLDFMDEPYVYSTGKDFRSTPRTKLSVALQSWMEIAAESGVKMSKGEKKFNQMMASVEIASSDSCLLATRKCCDWRTLYQALKVHDEDRKSRQGEKMRARRKRLDNCRPKIVKVRHATYKEDSKLNKRSLGSRMNLARANCNSKPSTANKIKQLRAEATVTKIRRATGSPPLNASGKSRSNFASAVAYAAVGKKGNASRKVLSAKSKTVYLAGGKRMNIPDAKTASSNVQKRLKMLKKGNASIRRI